MGVWWRWLLPLTEAGAGRAWLPPRRRQRTRRTRWTWLSLWKRERKGREVVCGLSLWKRERKGREVVCGLSLWKRERKGREVVCGCPLFFVVVAKPPPKSELSCFTQPSPPQRKKRKKVMCTGGGAQAAGRTGVAADPPPLNENRGDVLSLCHTHTHRTRGAPPHKEKYSNEGKSSRCHAAQGAFCFGITRKESSSTGGGSAFLHPPSLTLFHSFLINGSSGLPSPYTMNPISRRAAWSRMLRPSKTKAGLCIDA